MQEPRVWIVSAEHWPRALLRAELIERGFDAVGFENLSDAIGELVLPWSRPPALAVIDFHEQSVEEKLLERLRAAKIPIMAIVDSTRSIDEAIRRFGWTAWLRRPVSVGAIADTVARLTGAERHTAATGVAPR